MKRNIALAIFALAILFLAGLYRKDEARILELETQVSELQEKNNAFADYAVDLQEQLATFDRNNEVIKIVDEFGLLNDRLALGPAYFILEQERKVSSDGQARLVNTLLEASSNDTLWLLDYATGKKTFLMVDAGETIYLKMSPPNADGEVFLQYGVCYTNNDFSCKSLWLQTDIKIK
jgi:FtsZ-binding cell division protein ZapB